MIERYTRPEMARWWLGAARFEAMLIVEKAVAKVQGALGLIPREAATEIEKKGQFSVAQIEELEKTTKHDVIAFVSSVAHHVGTNGRFVHFALTSSDVLDTALSLQVRGGAAVLQGSIERLSKALTAKIKQHALTVCAGRTHGMHAEPTTLGIKLAGFLAELKRNEKRFKRAAEQMLICKLSGAVGTYSAQTAETEKLVAAELGLTCETVATQVIPRDRHAEIIAACALLMSGLERLAVELRHLQRTEVGEVNESFSSGQKGSSAMPHKKNPISAENITGLSRLVRGYAVSALENVALWHERDISHSSVERVIFPDTFIVTDYAIDRMAGVIENLQINNERMLQNMNLSHGQLYSSHVLLALVAKGLSREEAYAHVQRVSHALRGDEYLADKLKGDKEVMKILSAVEVERIFTGSGALEQSANAIIARVLND